MDFMGGGKGEAPWVSWARAEVERHSGGCFHFQTAANPDRMDLKPARRLSLTTDLLDYADDPDFSKGTIREIQVIRAIRGSEKAAPEAG